MEHKFLVSVSRVEDSSGGIGWGLIKCAAAVAFMVWLCGAIK